MRSGGEARAPDHKAMSCGATRRKSMAGSRRRLPKRNNAERTHTRLPHNAAGYGPSLSGHTHTHAPPRSTTALHRDRRQEPSAELLIELRLHMTRHRTQRNCAHIMHRRLRRISMCPHKLGPHAQLPMGILSKPERDRRALRTVVRIEGAVVRRRPNWPLRPSRTNSDIRLGGRPHDTSCNEAVVCDPGQAARLRPYTGSSY